MNRSTLRWLLLLSGLAFLPYFIPRRLRVVRQTIVRAKPMQIFPYLEDLHQWPLWTAWGDDATMKIAYEGTHQGVGAVQKWETPRMAGRLEITQALPGQRIAYEVFISNGKYHLEGILSLKGYQEFTQITWTCNWVTNENPYARYLDLACKCWMGRDFAKGLENLKNILEQTPVTMDVANSVDDIG